MRNLLILRDSVCCIPLTNPHTAETAPVRLVCVDSDTGNTYFADETGWVACLTSNKQARLLQVLVARVKEILH